MKRTNDNNAIKNNMLARSLSETDASNSLDLMSKPSGGYVSGLTNEILTKGVWCNCS